VELVKSWSEERGPVEYKGSALNFDMMYPYPEIV
jgi:hypothetical protein